VLPQFWPPQSGIPKPGAVWMALLFGALAGLLLPLILVLAGAGIDTLAAGHLGVADVLKIGPLSIPTQWMHPEGSLLRVILWILATIAAAVLVKMIALMINEYAAIVAGLDFDIQAQKRLFEKSGKLALQQGLSGQQARLRGLQQSSIPKVRDTIQLWYQVFPRYGIHLLALLALAGSIHFWVAVTAVAALLVLRAIYQNVESSHRKRRPVALERFRNTCERLARLGDTAPLLALVHRRDETAESFRSLLHTYRDTGLLVSRANVWKSPTLRLVACLFAILFLVLLAIRMLDSQDSIRLGEAFTLCASVLLAVHAYGRWRSAYAKCRTAQSSLQQITDYLAQDTEPQQPVEFQTIPRLTKELLLEHVCMRDNQGLKLLDDVCISMKPGQLTAVVASDGVQAKALAELILGFGRPNRGRMLHDGIDSLDIAREALMDSSFWIAPNGPLVTGSIEQNLWSDGHPDATIDLMDVAKRASVSDAILNLADGLQTLISPEEDRLPPDILFRLGVARGLVKRPSIVVAEEPSSRPGAAIEQHTTGALHELVKGGALVLVLAQRLSTLRAADQIIVVNDHRVTHQGTHAELLEQSELYRHLNYLWFASMH
jgi:ATP-binding cassette, subfamily B, bacterial